MRQTRWAVPALMGMGCGTLAPSSPGPTPSAAPVTVVTPAAAPARDGIRGRREPSTVLLGAGVVAEVRADGTEPVVRVIEASGRSVAWRLTDGPPVRMGDRVGPASLRADGQLAAEPEPAPPAGAVDGASTCASPGPGHGATVMLGGPWAFDACSGLHLVGPGRGRVDVGTGVLPGATFVGLLADPPASDGTARLWTVSADASSARIAGWAPADALGVDWLPVELAAGARITVPQPTAVARPRAPRHTFEVPLPDGSRWTAAARWRSEVLLVGAVTTNGVEQAAVLRVDNVP